MSTVLTIDQRPEALGALRSARRRNRIAQLDKFDAFYKAYVTGLFSVIAIYGAAGWLGDAAVRGSALETLRTDGASWLGLLVALMVAVGIRSGSRGGPLAFEQADVRHVLLAPVDRAASIRRPAMTMLRHAVVIGLAVGGAAGLVALRRLPETPALWVLSGALFGAVAATSAVGAAMSLGGLRAPAWVGDLLSVVVLLWAGVDAGLHLATSPFTWIAATALWPLEVDLFGIAGITVAATLAVVGLIVVKNLSVEAAERRSKLVGQLRFAATLQDVRTVMVLQRQLSQQHLRVRPRLPLPRARATKPVLRVFVRRSLNDLLRWPLFRFFRLLGLVAVAALSVWGIWLGNSFLIVPAGVALWIASLDLLEPLAQETDRSDRLRSFAHVAGWVLARHLLVPFLVMFTLLLLSAVPALVLLDDLDVSAALWPSLLLAAWLPLGAAALAVTRQPSVPTASVQSPEIAGLQMIWKAFGPPAIAVLAFVPMLLARRSWDEHHSIDRMLDDINLSMAVAFAIGSWCFTWIRYGSEMRSKFVSMGASSTGGAEAGKRVPKA